MRPAPLELLDNSDVQRLVRCAAAAPPPAAVQAASIGRCCVGPEAETAAPAGTTHLGAQSQARVRCVPTRLGIPLRCLWCGRHLRLPQG